jgi:hypothetical protein
VREQQRLQLGGRDLQRVDLDELLDPVDDEDIAVLVDAPEVARVQPAVGVEDLGGRLGRGEVSGQDDRFDPPRGGYTEVTECLVHIERRLGIFPVRRTYPHRTPPPETLEPGSLP